MPAAMALLLIVYGSWQLFHWIPGNRAVLGDVFFYPAGVAAIWAAWRASQRCQALPRLRSAWQIVAVASALYLAGDVAQTVYELYGHLPFPSLADVFYLSFYPLMLWGLLRFAAGRRTAAERVRLGLDLAVVAIGGSAIVLYLVLGPTAVAGAENPLEAVVSIAYPVGDMVLLVGLASLVLRQAIPSSERALQFMAVGLLFFVMADLAYGYINLHSTYQGGDPVDTLWMVAIAFFAVAAAAQRPATAPTGEAVEVGHRRTTWAPYVATATGFALLFVDESDDPFFPNLALVITAVALALLVSVRQFLAQRDLLSTQGLLSHQSLHDALTGLPNRTLVYDRAERMLAQARREGVPAAALYVDIDSFKQINDSFGHPAGDELLKIVASRLTAAVRETDTVGRLGGDEFVVLTERSEFDAGPELVAERLLEVLAQPIGLGTGGSRSVTIGASIGIAYGLDTSPDELLRDADLALYEAKATGKHRFTVFESRMQTAVQDRLELQMDLGEALPDREFFLLYQPVFELESKRMIGIEALIRWRHPTRGILTPESFLGIAEDTGLIVPIGRWVLETACEQAAALRSRGHSLWLSVNVGARQLEREELVEDVSGALRRSGLHPGSLTLEMTERALMRDPDAAVERLRALKALGVQIALDDFGTSYSSLAHLRRLPVDALKIDGSFISGAAAEGDSAGALVHTLVQLGKTLGMRTLGEGIEDRDQLEHLRREQCDFGQGFLLARPMEPPGLEEMLAAAEPQGASERLSSFRFASQCEGRAAV